MPTAQRSSSIKLGFIPTNPTVGSGTLALNAAATWLAIGFVALEDKTISKVKLYQSSQNGTNATSDCTCDIYSAVTTATGVPNTSVDGPKNATSTPAAGLWQEWSGFTTSIVRGQMIWFVFKNANGTPATNYPTYRYGLAGSAPGPGQTNTFYGPAFFKVHTTDSGTAWATSLVRNSIGPRIEFSDGTFWGWPISAIASVATASGVYNARELGVVFTSPANVRLVVRGIAFGALHQTGTPTGNVRYRLYNNTTLLGTTEVIANARVHTSATDGYYEAYFSSPITIEPGTTLRAVISETTQSDGSSKAFRTMAYTVENDANSKALMPFGSLKSTLTTDSTGSPPSFVDTDTEIYPFYLILDTDGEFAQSASTTIIRPRRVM